MICPASRYNHTDDLWIISCFYNPNSYKTKPINFDNFLNKIESANLNYLFVECAFGNQPFSLKKSPNIIRIRTKDIMWQKERLLNIAVSHLPSKCKKVAWIDCDVFFANPDWARETSIMLKHYKVIQPFKEVIRLPRYATSYKGSGERYYSFGYIFKQNPLVATEGRFNEHGHTGFAWASHRVILQKHGFYDVCIAGNGDHMMAHSFVGDWDTNCVKRTLGFNDLFLKHYLNWSKKIYNSVKSKVSFIDGTLLHLWHGDLADRKYTDRQKALEEYRYNPYTDIKPDNNNCWKWSHNDKELRSWAKQYFISRKEDG